ncbi:MAG: DNA-binding protein [Methylotenera sp.]|nr:DNA-binding protein [Methylotenera sp.]
MTREQIKAKFRKEGKSVNKWAKEHGFTPCMVYLVLNGQLKGNYGKSHDVAVALGIK